MDRLPFGRLKSGAAATLYTIESERIRVAVTDYGGRVVSLEAPDRHGRMGHVVLGFDTVDGYVEAGAAAFGALLGRTANRIGGGSFTLDGRLYHLSRNEGDNTLHGGEAGFEYRLWTAAEACAQTLELTLTSPSGDQGYPGELTVRARYRLAGDILWLEFTATTTEPTPVSLSAHPYFNLGGPAAPDIFSHEVTINAESFLPTDGEQIPTGEFRPVAGTPFDFRQPVAVGARIRAPDPQILVGQGYDHFFVLRDGGAEPRLAARARDPQSGRVLQILTTQPGLQFYTGDQLDASVAGRRVVYRQSAGLAFEPQGFPDAPNRPEFPSTIVHPGTAYRQAIGYRFLVE